MNSNNNISKVFAIVHGDSERKMCKQIGKMLRLKIKTICENNGASSIQILSLAKLLNKREDLKSIKINMN